MDDRWFEVRFPAEAEICSFSTVSRPALGPTHIPIQWATRALFKLVKRPRREGYHTAPPSAEVINVWSYTSTPPYISYILSSSSIFLSFFTPPLYTRKHTHTRARIYLPLFILSLCCFSFLHFSILFLSIHIAFYASPFLPPFSSAIFYLGVPFYKQICRELSWCSEWLWAWRTGNWDSIPREG
jgi:hypothetical protein